ncbi:MAG: bifunctional DNA primase/polymerase [Aeromicrobium sp.]
MTALSELPATLVESENLGDWAAELAVHGWRVFPLRPGRKEPAIPNPHPYGSVERQRCKGGCGRFGHGVLDATSDVEQVARWWGGRSVGANIGARVPDHVMVIDSDPRSGGLDAEADLVRAYAHFPTTLTVASGRGDGGTHRYYRAPDAKLTGKVRGYPGLDVKTSAGYCVVPPSIHPDSGEPYRWVNDEPIAEPPPWLVDLVTARPPSLVRRTSRSVWDAFRGASTADAFVESTCWGEVLEPHGWRCLDPDGDVDGARWLHPSATSACSATIRNGCLFVYSLNTPFDVTVPGSPHGFTRFRAYAVLNHGGDMSAAAREIKERNHAVR